ncbi:SpoIIE family protein phosphatase [Streptomyces peucetius]|uniref:SpoIIE family protein phosphatase n=1 Tax=Streptomyces peucetius TaxID=1950 RepID=UPI00299F596F|nr:SpoIIE family protein phosphatase [Streptomyces peucetius]
MHREATATCIYGLVKGPAQGPWELVQSSAGHLPPLLIAADGRTRCLEDGAGLLLGMDPDMPRPRARDAVPAHGCCTPTASSNAATNPWTIPWNGSAVTSPSWPANPSTCSATSSSSGWGRTNDDIAVLAVRPIPPP